MGWDKHYGYQLYQSDPSGNYGGWKATCIGNNSAVSIKIAKSKVEAYILFGTDICLRFGCSSTMVGPQLIVSDTNNTWNLSTEPGLCM